MANYDLNHIPRTARPAGPGKAPERKTQSSEFAG